MKKIILLIISFILFRNLSYAEAVIKVGVPTALTGDFAFGGDNLQKTAATYSKRYLRHPITFIFEDANKGCLDGLNAYRKLIDVDKVHMMIGGTTSNGTIAGAPLVNKSKTVLITPLTGGSNIDKAGEYIFRIGNSDVLNGYQQAELFLSSGITRVALFTEQTEYTQDIAKFFKERFLESSGKIVFDEDFIPDLPTFKSTIVKLNSRKPEAVLMSTQTGLAFGIFVKEFKQLAGNSNIDIHTNFVAASNPDAANVAGQAIKGIKYLAPFYDHNNPALIKFFKEFEEDHKAKPAIEFHTAGMVDALNMLQDYLDGLKGAEFSRIGFHDYLLSNIKNYQGLMGKYSFDKDGNADIGFEPAIIK